MTPPIIVCASDLGPSGSRAVDLAAIWAAENGGRLEVLHATEPLEDVDLGAMPPTMRPMVVDLIERVGKRREQEARELVRIETECRARGLDCRARLVEGRPWETLLAEAESLPAGGIVVGPHTSGIGLLGTTAGRVVRHATCPVFVAAGVAPIPESLAGRRWVVGVDFGPESRRAALRIGALVKKSGGELILVHALPPLVNEVASEWRSILVSMKRLAEAELHALGRAAEMTPGTLRVHVHRGGGAAREIVRIAREDHADFIAVGTHGRTGLRRGLLGSIAERTVREATVPVLVMRGEDAS